MITTDMRTFHDLEHCDRLVLDGFHLGLDGMKGLAEALQESGEMGAGLKMLKLGGCGIGDTGAIALAAVLKHHRELRSLHLNDNGIGDAGAKALAHALFDHPMKVLYLSSNFVTDKSAKALANMLRTQSGMEALALDGNGVTDVGAAELVEAAKVSNPPLEQLKLHNNHVTEEMLATVRASLHAKNYTRIMHERIAASRLKRELR